MSNFHLIWRQTFITTLGSEVWGLYQNVFVCFKLGKVFKSEHHLKIMHTVTRPLRGLVKCALFSSNAHFFILYLSLSAILRGPNIKIWITILIVSEIFQAEIGPLWWGTAIMAALFKSHLPWIKFYKNEGIPVVMQLKWYVRKTISTSLCFWCFSSLECTSWCVSNLVFFLNIREQLEAILSSNIT